MTYSEKLKDPRWQKKRLEILDRDNWTCQQCLSTDETLHVHHGYYEKDNDPWDYPSETLHTLCEHCHKDRHENELRIKRSLAKMGSHQIYAFAYAIEEGGDSFMDLIHRLAAWSENRADERTGWMMDRLRKQGRLTD